MATTGLTQRKTIENPGTLLTWTISVLACAFIILGGFAMFFVTRSFAELFASLGAELPLATRIVIGSYTFLVPLLFGCAAILVIAKQYIIRDKWPNISASFGVVGIVAVLSQGIIYVLYLPIFSLTEKLSK